MVESDGQRAVARIESGPDVLAAPTLVKATYRAAATNDPPRFSINVGPQVLLALNDHLGEMRSELVQPRAHAHLRRAPQRRPRERHPGDHLEPLVAASARVSEQLQHSGQSTPARIGEFRFGGRESIAGQPLERDGERVVVPPGRGPLDLGGVAQLHCNRMPEKIAKAPLTVTCCVEQPVSATDDQSDKLP